MHDNFTVMATIARKCETMCELSGGKILLMECKNALKHRSTVQMIADRSADPNSPLFRKLAGLP